MGYYPIRKEGGEGLCWVDNSIQCNLEWWASQIAHMPSFTESSVNFPLSVYASEKPNNVLPVQGILDIWVNVV